MVAPGLIAKVITQATLLASHSWEYGTAAEALLEYYNPEYSVFSKDPFPNGRLPTVDSSSVRALRYARTHILLNETTLADGEGSTSDPASLGIPALLLGTTNTTYTTASQRQLAHTQNTIRMPSGAISNREGYVSLWSNYIYNLPPFMAYYAVAANDSELLLESAWQCMLYREALGTTSGLWIHIVSTRSNETDTGRWTTGVGWAAAGMARVLATMIKAPLATDESTRMQLAAQIKTNLDGAMEADTASGGLLRNYLDDETMFEEVAGTALLVSTAYRMAVLLPGQFGKNYTDWAEKKREIIEEKVNNKTGIVNPVVNPYSWKSRNPAVNGSSEAQSFVVLMTAAYRDWNSMQNRSL